MPGKHSSFLIIFANAHNPNAVAHQRHGEWLEMWEGAVGRHCDAPHNNLDVSNNSCSTSGTDGNVETVVSGGLQQVVHLLRANNSASLAPVFAWHGFQYVVVVADNAAAFPGQLSSLCRLEIHPNVTSTGRLTFGGDGNAGSVSEDSADVLNGVQNMLLASQLSNLAAYVPISCPTTEKQGWTGDVRFSSEEALYVSKTNALPAPSAIPSVGEHQPNQRWEASNVNVNGMNCDKLLFCPL